MSKKVFLGGTANHSQWRETLKPMLTIDFFDPVVPVWNEEARIREIQERETCDYCLYVITPKMTGFYAVAEVVDDSNKRPDKTVYCVLSTDDDKEFEPHQIKSLLAVGKLVKRNGGHWLQNLNEVAEFLNTGIEPKVDS
ncbi:MAG: hypothetical protein J6Y24_08300 [Bacteroidales bacterium]|nr:hypothetical protein [Bacteroidales bacterium]